jgi:hypothetical protein
VHRPIHVGGSLLLDVPWLVVDAVRVMPSESPAASELGAFASKRGHVCLARSDQVTTTSANEPPENPAALKTTFLQHGRSLGAGAIGVQTVTNGPIYSDAVLFRVGPAVIEFGAIGRQPFIAATEHRLLSLVHGRAEAHKL